MFSHAPKCSKQLSRRKLIANWKDPVASYPIWCHRTLHWMLKSLQKQFQRSSRHMQLMVYENKYNYPRIRQSLLASTGNNVWSSFLVHQIPCVPLQFCGIAKSFLSTFEQDYIAHAWTLTKVYRLNKSYLTGYNVFKDTLPVLKNFWAVRKATMISTSLFVPSHVGMDSLWIAIYFIDHSMRECLWHHHGLLKPTYLKSG